MKTLTAKRILKLTSCALALGGLALATQAQTTVGLLNPIPPGVGIVDSPANVGNANFITQASMASTVSTAFNSNLGGVINWQAANGWVNNLSNTVQTVSYGTSQGNLLTITRNDGALNFFGASSGGGTTGTSGAQYLAFNGTGSPVDLTFSTGLLDWGMTMLDRGASRTVTFSFTLADSTVITYNAETQDPAGNNTGAYNWFGFQASAGNPLVGVSLTANGFTRWGDMAFVVAPVPEPATMTMLGLGIGSLAVMRRRCWFSKKRS